MLNSTKAPQLFLFGFGCYQTSSSRGCKIKKSVEKAVPGEVFSSCDLVVTPGLLFAKKKKKNHHCGHSWITMQKTFFKSNLQSLIFNTCWAQHKRSLKVRGVFLHKSYSEGYAQHLGFPFCATRFPCRVEWDGRETQTKIWARIQAL